MQIEKKVLCGLEYCYAVSVMGKEQNIFFASEAEGPCVGFDRGGDHPFRVWDGPGGTMSMVEIPGGDGDFLAVQNFFPVFQSEQAKLVWVHREMGGGFTVRHFVDIPYIHRFDLLQMDGVTYLIACTLCTSKRFVEDWSDPGKVYVGVMPDTPEKGIALTPLLEGLTHNHGYCSGMLEGKMTALVGSDEGLHAVYPPQQRGGSWSVEKLLESPVGDIAIVDIDGDGQEELAAIEPFHGTELVVYRKNGGAYEPMYRYPEKMEFGHTIWGGRLLGAPSILCGCRAGAMELFLLKMEGNTFKKLLIDAGAGPSNLAVLHRENEEIICAANRQIGEAALYTLRP